MSSQRRKRSSYDRTRKRSSTQRRSSVVSRGIVHTLVTAFRTLRTYIVNALHATRNSAPVRALATLCGYVVRTLKLVLKTLFAPVLAAGYLVRYTSQVVARTLSDYLYTLLVVVLSCVAWLYTCTSETLESWMDTTTTKGDKNTDDHPHDQPPTTRAKHLRRVLAVLRTSFVVPALHLVVYTVPQFTYIVLRIWHLILVQGSVHLADAVVRAAHTARTFLTGVRTPTYTPYANRWTEALPKGADTLEQHYLAATSAFHKQIQTQTKKGFVPLLTDALTNKLFTVPSDAYSLLSGAWRATHTYKTYNQLAEDTENISKTTLGEAWRTMKRTFTPVQRIANDFSKGIAKRVVKDDARRAKMHTKAQQVGKTVGDTVSSTVDTLHAGASRVADTVATRAGVTDAQHKQIKQARDTLADPTVQQVFTMYFGVVATAGALNTSTGRVVASRLPPAYRPVKDTLPIFLNS